MKYTIEEGVYPDENNQNEDSFKGNGWSAKKVTNEYLLEYISGEHRGKLKEVKISSKDFRLLKANKITIDDICIKYNVT
jgi:hypothetical protein